MTAKPKYLITVFLTAVSVIALSAAGAAQASKSDVLLGSWDVQTEDGSYVFVFEFSMKDGKLAGKFSGSSGTSEMANLTFEENILKFSVTVGNGMVIDFSAIVAEETLSGKLSLEYGEAPITGRKRK